MLSYYIPAERRFSDYKECQLSVTATNFNPANACISLIFNSEVPVVEAVLASALAYPVAFPAIGIGGGYYVDGGALSNAPG